MREVEKIVRVPVKGETETRIEYVERAAGDPAQVKIETAPPRLVAEVNGRQLSFDSVSGEKYVFEKGQLILRQDSTTTLDLTAWANKELAGERERIKKEYHKPQGIGVAALGGVSQSYVGIEYENRSLVAGGYRGVRGGGDKYLVRVGWRWRF